MAVSFKEGLRAADVVVVVVSKRDDIRAPSGGLPTYVTPRPEVYHGSEGSAVSVLRLDRTTSTE